MKFRYYITDLHSGSVMGTNTDQTAEDFRHSEDHFVVDSVKGVWLVSDGETDIQSIES